MKVQFGGDFQMQGTHWQHADKKGKATIPSQKNKKNAS